MTEPEPTPPGATNASERFKSAVISFARTAKSKAIVEKQNLKADYAHLLERYAVPKAVKKMVRAAWKTAPTDLRKRSNHVVRLRTVPTLLVIIFVARLFFSSPSELLPTLFSVASLLIVAGVYLSYKLARKRAIEFSIVAAEWIWERLPDDHQAELFDAAYGRRNAGDIIAPWMQTRSRSKEWISRKLSGFIPPKT